MLNMQKIPHNVSCTGTESTEKNVMSDWELVKVNLGDVINE